MRNQESKETEVLPTLASQLVSDFEDDTPTASSASPRPSEQSALARDGDESWQPSVGDRLGKDNRFQLVETLGSGAMGRVFKALDGELSRYTAVKIIMPRAPRPADQIIALLKNEARAIAKLNHRNIVQIYDIGMWRGLPFLVMEFLRGHTLKAEIARGPIPYERALDIARRIVEGLVHAHHNGLIHRDLKPGNIIVLHDGSIKLLDFGLVYRVEQFANLGNTFMTEYMNALTFERAGTPAFMSPEQWGNQAPDERTDIWAVGMLFYNMLVGKLPFAGLSVAEVRDMVLSPEPMPLTAGALPDAPEVAAQLIERMLAKSVDVRIQSATELLETLTRMQRDVAESRPAELGQQSAQRQLTLLACQLRITGGELDFETTGQLSRSFHYSVDNVLKRGGGTLVAAVGSRMVACFGYPRADEDDAQYAVQAALELRDTAVELGRQFGVKSAIQVGLHTDRVLVDTDPFSGMSPGWPVLRGNAPDAVSVLRDQARPGDILICGNTHRLVRGLFATQKVDAPAMRHPWPPTGGAIHRVLRPVEVQMRFNRAADAALAPLVGRDHEIAEHLDLWLRACAGRGQVAMISGEAGIGKSRLVRQIVSHVRTSECLDIALQCWQQHANSAFYPILGLLRRFMTIRDENSDTEKIHHMERSLQSLDLDLDRHMPLYASLLAVELPDRYQRAKLPRADKKQTLIESLVVMLGRMASKRPLLLVVEDLHWIDPSTLDFLSALFARVADTPVLVLLTFRPGFSPHWPSGPHVHHTQLGRLNYRDVEAFAKFLAGRRTLPEEQIRTLFARTEGIPLYVEEFARQLFGTERHSTRASGVIELNEASVPATLANLLLARVDRLSPEQQYIARLGSAIGRDFDAELIRAVSQYEKLQLAGCLSRLVESGLLAHTDGHEQGQFVFSHALLQQTVYESMTRQTRSAHHLRVARALEDSGRAVEPERLAYHYERAGHPATAIVHLERASKLAVRRSALVEAIHHLRHALELLNGLPKSQRRSQREFDLLNALGPALMAVKGYAHPEIQKVYSRAQTLCQVAGDHSSLFASLHGLWEFKLVRGALPEARALGARLLEVAELSLERTKLLLAHRALGTALLLSGELAAGRDHSRKAANHYEIARDARLSHEYGHDPGMASHLYVAWSLALLGELDLALTTARNAEAIALELGQPINIAFARSYLGMVCNQRGDFSAAFEVTRQAGDLAVAKDLLLWNAHSLIQHGWAIVGMGRLEEGIATLKKGIDRWCKTGAQAGTTMFYTLLANAYLAHGQLDDCANELIKSEEMITRNDEHYYEPEVLRVRGELTLARNPHDVEAAATYLRDALEVAHDQGGKTLGLRAAISLFRITSGAEQAEQQLRSVTSEFTEGLDTADMRTARRLLGQS